ncbi:ATP-binding protein [Streptomyces sp. NPDC053513]|uniref:ATP-binding protein n=1 Tax=unclassified Streptomyces TaxID=2593676 RepID=UPI0037D8AC14
MTSFVGRRREVAEAKRLLSHVRVLTLTGPGGVGKTRLALRVAEAARHSFPDGVWLVELADLADPSLLAETVAEHLGLHEHGARPSLDVIIDRLEPCEALLVIDNCEHLIDHCALFVAAVVRACPQVRVLATSRQSLGIQGETVLPVAPLHVPDPEGRIPLDALAQHDAVRLFVERARAVEPAFEVSEGNRDVLARLCHALDGIPLAIELAVAWLRALTPAEIEERLSERYRLLTTGPRNVPSRQRTLRALVDWSHQLCSRPEQLVWARTSVFAGGFDLAAAEHVAAGDGVPPEDIPQLLRSLVDKSVLIRDEGGGRYRMLETLREYGHERLAQAGESLATRRRHRDWYATVIERLDAEWFGPDQVALLQRLDDEHANLRVAFDHSLNQPGESIGALRMAGGMINDYWNIRGLNAEGRYWLEQSLAACPEPTGERVWGLCLKAMYAILRGDFDVGAPVLAEADELSRRLGGVRRPHVVLMQALSAQFTGAHERAVPLAREATAGFRATEESALEIFALNTLGISLALAGDREQGLARLEESLTRTARAGELYFRSWALWTVAFIEAEHDTERAERAGQEALGIHNLLDNRAGSAFVLETLAQISVRKKRYARAATLFGAAASIWRAIGAYSDVYIPAQVVHRQCVSIIRGVLGEARYEAVFAQGYRFSPRQAVDFALGNGAPAKARTRGAGEGTPLTPRETEVAALVAEGLSNKEIAARLVIATRTAETHVDHILTKLGFGNRAQVAAWYTARKNPARDVG